MPLRWPGDQTCKDIKAKQDFIKRPSPANVLFLQIHKLDELFTRHEKISTVLWLMRKKNRVAFCVIQSLQASRRASVSQALHDPVFLAREWKLQNPNAVVTTVLKGGYRLSACKTWANLHRASTKYQSHRPLSVSVPQTCSSTFFSKGILRLTDSREKGQ